MSLVQQLIHLEPEQKAAFLERKKAGHGSLSEQIRTASDRYLNNESTGDEELELALEFAKDAEKTIKDMNKTLDVMNKKLDQAFAKINRLNKKSK